MPTYTFQRALVLIEGTGEPAIGASGVLRPAAGMETVPIYDLNGSQIASVQTGPQGVTQAFKADIPDGVLDFGSVALPVISQEAQSAALEVQQAATDAQVAASSSASSANAALAAVGSKADRLQTVAVVKHDGTPGGGARPEGFSRIIWTGGTTRPTNMAADDVWEHDA